jgi:hypothetical protein
MLTNMKMYWKNPASSNSWSWSRDENVSTFSNIRDSSRGFHGNEDSHTGSLEMSGSLSWSESLGWFINSD